MIFLTALYLIACAWLLIVSARALYYMNKHTNHMRRIAFALTACGSFAAFIEAWEVMPHEFSGPMIAVGVATLFFLGARETRIVYSEHALNARRK